MTSLLIPLQQIPAVAPQNILTTLIAAIVVLLIVRFLLGVALKVAVLAAIVAGMLWFLGALRTLSLSLPA